MKNGFILPDPCRQLLFDDLPNPVFFLHSQHDAVAPVIAHIHGEQSLLQSVGFAKIEFPQPAISLYQFSKLNVPNELNLHKAYFRILNYQFLFDYKSAAFLKNSEFLRRDRRVTTKILKIVFSLYKIINLIVPILSFFSLFGGKNVQTGGLLLEDKIFLSGGSAPDESIPCCQDDQRCNGATGHQSCHRQGGMVVEDADEGGNKGPDTHLYPPQEGRGGTCISAKKGQGQRRGIGENTALAA
jgi:hypothetical protein